MEKTEEALRELVSNVDYRQTLIAVLARTCSLVLPRIPLSDSLPLSCDSSSCGSDKHSKYRTQQTYCTYSIIPPKFAQRSRSSLAKALYNVSRGKKTVSSASAQRLAGERRFENSLSRLKKKKDLTFQAFLLFDENILGKRDNLDKKTRDGDQHGSFTGSEEEGKPETYNVTVSAKFEVVGHDVLREPSQRIV